MGSSSTKPDPTLNELIHSHDVLMFSKTGCPYCVRAQKVFDRMELSPKVYLFDKEKKGVEVFRALVELTNQRTVPNIFITQQHIGGYAELLSGIKNRTVQNLLTKAGVPFKDFNL
jgi:glutaredoxin 3